jgi:TorA maturation chaperone TorD
LPALYKWAHRNLVHKMNTDYNNILKGYNMLLYFAGSMVMNEPTEECVIDFWINGKLRNLPVSSSNPRFVSAAALLRESCPDKDQCKSILAEDFCRLFSGAGLPLAPAFASLYINKGMDEGKPKPIVAEFYDSYGWGSRVRGKVPDDHLGIELLFLTQMIDKYLQLDDEPCRIEMQNEIKRFIDIYILSWIPLWNQDVQEYAKSSCYRAIGTLIHACTEDIRGLMA